MVGEGVAMEFSGARSARSALPWYLRDEFQTLSRVGTRRAFVAAIRAGDWQDIDVSKMLRVG